MKSFLQSSDLYIAYQILELLPADYLLHHRCVLLARIGKYREAFDLAIGTLNELAFAERIAILATVWRPENKKVYTQMHASLYRAGHTEAAKQLLKKQFKHIDFLTATSNMDESELMDDQLLEVYQRAFVQMEKLEKRVNIQLNLAKCQYQKIQTEEHHRASNVYFEVSEETQCS